MVIGLDDTVLAPQTLPDKFSDGIEEKSEDEQNKCCEEEYPVMGTSYFSFRHLDGNIGRKCSHALKYIHIHDRCITCSHKHDHGFTDRSTQANHDSREDTGARGRQDHPDHRLPLGRPQCQRAIIKMFWHTEDRIFGNRKNCWYDCESHCGTDHQCISLVVIDTQL